MTAVTLTFEERLELGRQAKANGWHRLAIMDMQEALALEPEHPDLPFELVSELRALQRLDEAMTLLQELAIHRPMEPRVPENLGHIALQAGDPATALAHFRAALTLRPEDENLVYVIATELRGQGRLDDAAAILKEHPTITATSKRVARLHGQIARQQGDLDTALAHYQTALALNPQSPTLILDVVTVFRELDRLDEARALLEELGERSPNEVRVPQELGYIARRRGDHEAALEHFKAALILRPDHINQVCNIADELRALNRLDEAADLLERHAVQSVAAMGIHVKLGQIARQQGDREKALKHFRTALAMQPDNPKLPINIASELCELGRLDEAETLLTELKIRFPDSSQASVGLGRIARRRGDHGAALEHFRNALALQPDNANLPIEIATELQEQGQFDEAYELLVAQLHSANNPGSIWLRLGRIALYQDDSDKALAFFLAGIQAEPENPSCYLAAAQEYQHRYFFDLAAGILDKGLTRVVPKLNLEIARARLFKARGWHVLAQEAAERLWLENPGNFACGIVLIDQLLLIGEFGRAQEVVESIKAITLSEQYQFWIRRALLARACFDVDQAEQHLQAALALEIEERKD